MLQITRDVTFKIETTFAEKMIEICQIAQRCEVEIIEVIYPYFDDATVIHVTAARGTRAQLRTLETAATGREE